MSEQIGPNMCYECGGDYGEHADHCPVLKRKKFVGEPISEAEAAKIMYLPVLRCRYGDDISFIDGLAKLWDELKSLPRPEERT